MTFPRPTLKARGTRRRKPSAARQLAGKSANEQGLALEDRLDDYHKLVMRAFPLHVYRVPHPTKTIKGGEVVHLAKGACDWGGCLDGRPFHGDSKAVSGDRFGFAHLVRTDRNGRRWAHQAEHLNAHVAAGGTGFVLVYWKGHGDATLLPWELVSDRFWDWFQKRSTIASVTRDEANTLGCRIPDGLSWVPALRAFWAAKAAA